MLRPSELDRLIASIKPPLYRPRETPSRIDTHQYLTYVVTHYDPCFACPSDDECPPCPYTTPPRPRGED